MFEVLNPGKLILELVTGTFGFVFGTMVGLVIGVAVGKWLSAWS